MRIELGRLPVIKALLKSRWPQVFMLAVMLGGFLIISRLWILISARHSAIPPIVHRQSCSYRTKKGAPGKVNL